MANRYALVGTCRPCCLSISGTFWRKIYFGFMVAVALSATLTAGTTSSFPALILLGDSTLDVGTNNYLDTVIKSDFLPYGRDLQGQFAGSGRFSNGLLVPDYIASFLGLPSPLPYLDPNANGDKLVQGINFASAGSGWLNSTSTIYSVRSMTQQRQDFKDYTGRLTELVGTNRAQDILSNALYIVSSGANDWVSNYFLFQRESYTTLEWQNLIISEVSQFLQDIYNLGARKILVSSVPAIGCLPAAISLYGEGSNRCVDYINDVTVNTNIGIQQILGDFEGNQKLPGVKFVYNEVYATLVDAIEDPISHGYEQVRFACCGTGTVEVAVLCNTATPNTCSDASQFLFFDSFHPTQKFYSNVSQMIIERITTKF